MTILKNKKFLAVSAVAVAILAQSPVASAKSGGAINEFTGYVGAQAGLSLPNGGSQFAFGAVAGYKVQPTLGVGAFVNTYSVIGIRTTSYGLEGNYFLEGALQGLQIGAKIGLSTSSTGTSGIVGGQNVTVSGSGGTNFIIGPKVNYDVVVADNITVGGEFNILFASGGNTPNILGEIKYNF